MSRKNIFALITAVSVSLLFSLNAYAWKTKGDRYQNSSSGSGGYTIKGFTEKGIPALITDAPVSHAIDGVINIKIDGEYEYFFYKPINKDGRVLIAFRELFELFDMDVLWDGELKKAIASGNGKTIEITAESEKVYVDGYEKLLDVPAQIINSRTYIPLRFIAESLGFGVGWDDSSQTVIINTRNGGGI